MVIDPVEESQGKVEVGRRCAERQDGHMPRGNGEASPNSGNRDAREGVPDGSRHPRP